MQSDVPIGVPYPLWVVTSNQDDPDLLPTGCRPRRDRRNWLLLVVSTGNLALQWGDEVLRLQAQDCLIIPHPAPDLGLLPQEEPWSIIALGFIGFDELMQKLSDNRQRLRLPADGWAMRQLHMSEEQAGRLQSGAAIRLVAGIVANLVEHNLMQDERSPQTRLMRRAIEAMDAAVERDISLAELARELDITPSHLSHVFKQHLGQSPRQYLQQRRMRRACNLLRDYRLDVETIAYRLGYSTHAAFTAAFKSSIGLTPSEFRKSRSVPLWTGEA